MFSPYDNYIKLSFKVLSDVCLYITLIKLTFMIISTVYYSFGEHERGPSELFYRPTQEYLSHSSDCSLLLRDSLYKPLHALLQTLLGDG
jgi:hypothetical protein